VDSTRLAAEVGDRRWRHLLDEHDVLVRRELDRFKGREIVTTGDGFLATFDGPGRAVRCALSITEKVAPIGVRIRAGIHTGEVDVRGSDVGGLAVHIAARVAALAAPGEVLVSSTVKDLLVGSGIEFEGRGDHDLKGVPETCRLFAATAESAARTHPDKRRGPRRGLVMEREIVRAGLEVGAHRGTARLTGLREPRCGPQGVTSGLVRHLHVDVELAIDLVRGREPVEDDVAVVLHPRAPGLAGHVGVDLEVEVQPVGAVGPDPDLPLAALAAGTAPDDLLVVSGECRRGTSHESGGHEPGHTESSELPHESPFQRWITEWLKAYGEAR
jgi:hypothetical protein